MTKNFRTPIVELLSISKPCSQEQESIDYFENINSLNGFFQLFNLPLNIKNTYRGSVTTIFEIEAYNSFHIKELLKHEDKLCKTMGLPNIRFLTPIPGTSNFGIEVSNKVRNVVTIGDIYSDNKSIDYRDEFFIPIGTDIYNKIEYSNLVKLPHLLIGGNKGSGKSTFLNTIILSILIKVGNKARFIMVDTKSDSLIMYQSIPNLIEPVIKKPEKARVSLLWAVEEARRRYQLFIKNSVKSIDDYNNKVQKIKFNKSSICPLPYIFIIIDELSEVISGNLNKVEDMICRISYIGQTTGVHMIISSCTDSGRVLTGLIRANLTSKIAFKTNSISHSRKIVCFKGAERLLVEGDMLYLSINYHIPKKLHSFYVSQDDIKKVVFFLKGE